MLNREDNGFANATPTATTALREINIALQPLIASLANEAQEVCAFGLGTPAANQNDQSEMRSSRGELQKVVAIASDHHALVTPCGRKNVVIRSAAPGEDH